MTVRAASGRRTSLRRRHRTRFGFRLKEIDEFLAGVYRRSGAELTDVDDPDLHVVQLVRAFFEGLSAHGRTQPISRLMTRASFLPPAGLRTSLVAYRSPLLGIAVPLREMRASTTTLLNCDSLREAIIAIESSR